MAFSIFKQQVREKLGGSTGSKKSANESVDAEWEATEALRENVKRIIKLVAKHEKAVKHYSDAGEELSDYLLKIHTELGEMDAAMLASAILDTKETQKMADATHTTLIASLEHEVREHLTMLTENEFKDAKVQEARYDKTRVALDAAISEVAAQKANKKAKPEAVQSAEAKQELAQQAFDLSATETQELLQEVNLSAEAMLIEKCCDYLTLYREYFQTMSRSLNDIIPSLYNYKRYVQESKETRESVLLPPRAPPEKQVFGLSLQDIIARQGGTVPILVQATIDWLSEKALEEPGLFRISASAPELAQLKNWCNSTDNPDFTTVNDPHLVAALLKTYFRELPEPILTYNLYQPLIDTNEIKDISQKVISVKAALDSLPDGNYQTLRLLMWLLNCVIIYEDKNMMSAGNLATCWAPNLMAPEIIDPATFDPFEPRAVIEFIILHYNEIFPEDAAE